MFRKRVLDLGGLVWDQELMLALGNRTSRARGAWVYAALWGIAEDWGGYEPDYKRISIQLCHLEISKKEVQKFVEIFIKLKKIIEYKAKDGRQLHWLKNLLRHQRLNTPPPPTLPLPPWITCELKKYKSGRQFAEYRIVPDALPEGFEQTAGVVHAVCKQSASSLHADFVQAKETETETETETNKGREVPTSAVSNSSASSQDKPEDRAFGSPFFDEENEKKEFHRVREHLEKQCAVLVGHFNLRAEFKPGQSIKGRDFNPIGFIFYARQKRIPVAVIVKVIDSMVRQKEDITSPYGWIISVLESEYKEFSYAKELEDHEQRKKWGLSSIGEMFKGVVS